MSPVSSSIIIKTARLCIAVLAMFALSAPAASAAQDLRSPDAVDAATPRLDAAAVKQDLRSPDAVDAATPRLDAAAAVKQDLRSPDAVDAATPRLDAAAAVKQDLRSPDAVDAATPRLDGAVDGTGSQSSASESGGFDWSSAGVAMAALIGLLVAATAAATLVRHTRRTVARP